MKVEGKGKKESRGGRLNKELWVDYLGNSAEKVLGAGDD